MARPKGSRNRPKIYTPASDGISEESTPVATPAPRPKLDPVRVELMKRIYVARDPESTAPTWLHHPDCPPRHPNCEAHGCGAFSGLKVGAMIDRGWWNDVPGDH